MPCSCALVVLWVPCAFDFVVDGGFELGEAAGLKVPALRFEFSSNLMQGISKSVVSNQRKMVKVMAINLRESPYMIMLLKKKI